LAQFEPRVDTTLGDVICFAANADILFRPEVVASSNLGLKLVNASGVDEQRTTKEVQKTNQFTLRALTVYLRRSDVFGASKEAGSAGFLSLLIFAADPTRSSILQPREVNRS